MDIFSEFMKVVFFDVVFEYMYIFIYIVCVFIFNLKNYDMLCYFLCYDDFKENL